MFLLVLLALTIGEAGWNGVLSFLTLGDAAANITVTEVVGISNSQIGIFSTMYFTGQLVAAPYLGYLADQRGRRPALLFSLLIAMVGGVFIGLAPVSATSSFGFVPLLIACVVQGCGVGGAIPITEALIVEHFDDEDEKQRGFWSCLVSLGWPFGTIITTSLAWILVPPIAEQNGGNVTNAVLNVALHTQKVRQSNQVISGWQSVWSAQGGLHGWPGLYVTLAAINAVCILWIWAKLPESSKFIKMQREKLESPMPKSSRQRGGSPSKYSLSLSRSDLWTWILVCIIWFAVSFSGNGFAVTLPLLLNKRSSGPNSRASYLYPQLMLWSIVGVPGVFLAAYLVEWKSFGRQRVVILSSILTALCFLGFTIFQSQLAATLTSSAQNVAVMCCWAGIATLTSELAPTTHRARLMGVSNMVKAVAGIAGPYVAGLFIESRPALPVFVFAGVMLLGSVAGMLLPNDTLGKKLSDDWRGDNEKGAQVSASTMGSGDLAIDNRHLLEHDSQDSSRER